MDTFVCGLLHAKGIGSSTFKKLFTHFGSVQEIYINAKDNLEAFPEGIRNSVKWSLGFNDSSFTKNLKKFGINVVYFHHDEYPLRLREVNDPPICLYFKGDISIASGSIISIVGTRKSTEYSSHILREIAQEIKDLEITVCSGLANGVDSIAHSETLSKNIKNISVIPSSPHKSVPVSNSRIYFEILNKGGLICSEFGPKDELHPGMFARRNRIIAGLATVILVTEAPTKSGALITARLGNEYDREVFAVPGDLRKSSSGGVNELIVNNLANLYTKPSQLLDIFEIRGDTDKKKYTLKLTKDQICIYDLLLSGSKNIDELTEISKFSLESVQHICLELELDNIVAKDKSGRYTLI